MRPEDEAAVQRSIEEMKQWTDEQVHTSLTLTTSRLREREHDRERLKAKIDSEGRRSLSDRAALVNISHQIDYLTLLVAAVRQMVKSRQKQTRSAEAVSVTIHNTANYNTDNYNTANTAVYLNLVNETRGSAEAGNRTSAPKKPKPPKKPSDRDMKIYSVIEKGSKGRLYARAVDRAGVPTPENWTEQGCPRTYAQAYDADECWRNLMRKERSRIKNRVRKYKTSPDPS